MNFYLKVEIAREGYLKRLRSNTMDVKDKALIAEKAVALRNIVVFIDLFIRSLPPLYQHCVQAFLANELNHESAASSICIPSQRMKDILTEIDARIEKIVGEKTIKSICYAKTGNGIRNVTICSRRNMERFIEKSVGLC